LFEGKKGHVMNNFSIAIVFIFFFLMAGLLIFYFQTQQSLKDIADKMSKLQPQRVLRFPNVIRQERAVCQDRLVLLEVDLTQNQRENLNDEEIQHVESARDAIKRCNDELKQTGDWMGTPFDFEWTEMFNRMPTLKSFYWASVEGLTAVDHQGLSGDPGGGVTGQK
jgi:hypothetical protein